MSEIPPNQLANRLNRLFATVHPRGRGPYSNEDVAKAIRAQGGDISKQYIAYLRNGERDNPRLHHLEALARFFGVRAAYFFDDEAATEIDRKLDQLAALRDAGVHTDDLLALKEAGVTEVATRAAGLSPKGLSFASALLDQLRRMEGLPPKSPSDQ
ncbi:helix-turn-helix transcriptional regulator [Streptomyces sp. NPDC052396]|uniref:helix-turn-helix transcriptional regulator n=1 Tax=Streptomyces sp. NPDC052396 TaxID=3365689 RepID=UPI0037CDD6AD